MPPDDVNVTTEAELLLTKVGFVNAPTETPGVPLVSLWIETVKSPFAVVDIVENSTSTLFRVYPVLLLPVVNAWA